MLYWKDKIDNEDVVSAKDINDVANAVIENAESIKRINSQIENINSKNELMANALRGHEIGEILYFDDVSPVEHTMDVAVLTSSFVGDLTSVKVIKCGKNLLSYPYNTKGNINSNGIYFTDNGDGTITANGTATSRAQYRMIGTSDNKYLKNGTYTISGCPSGGSSDTYCIVTSNGRDIGEGHTFVSVGNSAFYFNITIEAGTTVENLLFKPQLEFGKIVTNYAAPQEHIEHEVEENGKVNGIVANGNDIALYTDTDGTYIDCIYNIDINDAFEKLRQEIDNIKANI